METKSISNHGQKLIKVDACRVARRLGNGMDQNATLKEELDIIEAKNWGMHEEVELGIETTNLDKDVV